MFMRQRKICYFSLKIMCLFIFNNCRKISHLDSCNQQYCFRFILKEKHIFAGLHSEEMTEVDKNMSDKIILNYMSPVVIIKS